MEKQQSTQAGKPAVIDNDTLLWRDLMLHGICIQRDGKRLDPADFIAGAEHECKNPPGYHVDF